MFTPTSGEDSHFGEHIFQMGWFNHQPVNFLGWMFVRFQGRFQLCQIQVGGSAAAPATRAGAAATGDVRRSAGWQQMTCHHL